MKQTNLFILSPRGLLFAERGAKELSAWKPPRDHATKVGGKPGRRGRAAFSGSRWESSTRPCTCLVRQDVDASVALAEERS